MKITPIRVTCRDCRKVSDVEVVTEAPIEVAIASMRAARCPACRSANLGLGGSYDDPPPVTAPLTDRAAWWLQRGDTGTSSLTIFQVLRNGTPSHPDIPYDPEDFQRCKQLLDLIPEWRRRLPEVSKRFPWWQPYVDAWDEMEALYAAEVQTGRCEKLYTRMKELEKESNAIRGRL